VRCFAASSLQNTLFFFSQQFDFTLDIVIVHSESIPTFSRAPTKEKREW